ncbi:MAG: phage tail sheath family protein [Alphaproteobacteria bacterium]|nr:phage tail sheath family protein [Alphaproteobacteria bacterium]MCB9699151.1 phage tail sheath family protein [Alphaproteobacteria bacterium]
MEYHTPGVYIREVDSGARPIASVATSVPGFIGLFTHKAKIDAVSISATKDGQRQMFGKVTPQLVDTKGAIPSENTEDAVVALQEAFKIKRTAIKDLKALLELNGHKPSIGKAPSGRTKITVGKESVEVNARVVDVEGKVISETDVMIEEMLNTVHAAFPLDKPKPKTAKDLLSVYGYDFHGAKGTALMNEYSVPPFPVTNKSEFFRWLQSYFAQYMVETRSVEELVGYKVDDPDEAADAVFDALTTDEALKLEFRHWLSQPSIFNFVAAVNGFYDNGGGKSYVYLMGVQDLDVSIRENQADKLGLYAFDDCDDMAIHVAPGLNFFQQKEMLEHCETRKDRFAVIDGPKVSLGDLEIPASNKGFGAMYVPWVKITKPSWFVGEQEEPIIRGMLRRKLIKCEKNEVMVPPSGHVTGVFARVDTERGVHKAPANEILMGITGLTQNINRIEQGQYNDRGVNVIRIFKDRGIRIWGARTLATKSDPQWKYVNVRRLFIMIEQSILQGMQWAVFEPNDKFLWSKLTRDVRAYLMRVWRSGALFGNTPEEAFYVKCDSETNPRYLIDAGQVNVQVGICPVKPAEFVIFSIGQWDGGALIED